MGSFFDLLSWLLAWKHGRGTRGPYVAEAGCVFSPGGTAGGVFSAGGSTGEVFSAGGDVGQVVG